MPIYEFYCNKCNTIFQFFSRIINTTKLPNCPQCNDVQLSRIASTFAAISSSSESSSTEDNLPPVDEAKMEKALVSLAEEAGKIDENDPKQAAQLMRKLTKETGLKLGSGMEEALNRLEKGEDPEKIEKEMGDFLETDEPFLIEGQKSNAQAKSRMKRDDKLYDL